MRGRRYGLPTGKIRRNVHREGQLAKEIKKERGLFERPIGSGVWWINYYVNGKQHREKVGSRSNAIALYRKRKEDDRAGRKLPVLRNSRFVNLSELIDDVLEYTKDHKDFRSYVSKAEIVRKALGPLAASELTPQEISRWLNSHCKTAGTHNRYKAFISLCYREGLANNKVTVNPARLIRMKGEGRGRLRFLSREEYAALHKVIAQRSPEHLAEFVISVHTGMRLSEQYSLEWGQVDLTRRAIELDKTKNGDARTVHLNAVSIDALLSVRPARYKSSDRVFPREERLEMRKKESVGSQERFDTRSWFVPCLDDAKITGYTWHCNRHTFCSWLAMAGATIKEIQEAAGHKTITMAARYAHLSPDHRLSVVERIAA